jgi:tRNA dimethylallyltransferase
MKQRIIFLVGPTAVGKTEVGLKLAGLLKTEVISCDSMQVYRGMEVVTSQPPPAVRKSIKHHLIGIVSPAARFNVARYRRLALQKIQEVLKRRKTCLFVGGSGLYMSALIDGIFQEKTENKALRHRLYQLAIDKPSGYLHDKLKKVDPQAAAKIHPRDIRRIVRALEVWYACGKPISALQKLKTGLAGPYEIKIFCLDMLRQDLYQRIDQRVDEMFSSGLEREVKRLSSAVLSRTARSAIGIKELKGYYRGKYSLQEAKRLMQRNSRHYAKRQLSWFRRDKRIIWVKVKNGEHPAAVAKKIISFLS